ncbi:tyrosine-type recombinase/integrase [Undibacterium sp. Di26W]|uniref:tyrosine-type recombinase/integrase n=1 Tax=Undibacterium sp. Di26W TaxID=3413035 RepID=UPI003BF3E603
MASFEKLKRGVRAQIQIKVNGEMVRKSQTFPTKAQAAAWASEEETTLRKQKATGVVAGKTFTQACERYDEEVSATKRGHRWESLRLGTMQRVVIDGVRLGDRYLTEITPDIIGKWRDIRMQIVTGSTVNREFNLISNVFSVARDEWRWMPDSPTTKVRRPKSSLPRNRLVSDIELEKLQLSANYQDGPVTQKQQAVMAGFLFSIETAMRLGEVCGLRPSHINGPVAYLPMTKNGTARHVPLSKRALEILTYLPKPEGDGTLFMASADSASTLFRKITKRCALDGDDGIHFHDSRHEAITRLAKKLNVLDLARVTGIRDLKILNVYYNETAESMAARLG